MLLQTSDTGGKVSQGFLTSGCIVSLSISAMPPESSVDIPQAGANINQLLNKK